MAATFLQAGRLVSEEVCAMAAEGFSVLGLDPRLVQHCKKKGFKGPTSVQSAAIPEVLKGKDVVAMARTGTGKTLAYLLPLLHSLVEKKLGKQAWEALVLVPTRELCLQVTCGRWSDDRCRFMTFSMHSLI